MTDARRKELGIGALPGSLYEAIEASGKEPSSSGTPWATTSSRN